VHRIGRCVVWVGLFCLAVPHTSPQTLRSVRIGANTAHGRRLAYADEQETGTPVPATHHASEYTTYDGDGPSARARRTARATARGSDHADRWNG
jgi:hypothetical protein